MQITAPAPIQVTTPKVASPLAQPVGDACVRGERRFGRHANIGDVRAAAQSVAMRWHVKVDSVDIMRGPGDTKRGIAVFCGSANNASHAARFF